MDNEIRIYDLDSKNTWDPYHENKFEYVYKKGKRVKKTIKTDSMLLSIQLFGMDKNGTTYSITVSDYKPYFYIKIPDDFDVKYIKYLVKNLLASIDDKRRPGYYNDSILSCDIVNKHNLYGFDNNKYHKFLKLTFKNGAMFNKIKNLWYSNDKSYKDRHLLKNGFRFSLNNKVYYFKLYEASLPPLLRFIHDINLNTTGWIRFNKKDIKPSRDNNTTCDIEYNVSYKDILPIDKIENVPLKIMSFDIEASSSHGDFPLAKKTYRKLAGDILTYWVLNKDKINRMHDDNKEKILFRIINTAFGFDNICGINKVYVKNEPSEDRINSCIENILGNDIRGMLSKIKKTGDMNEIMRQILNDVPRHCLDGTILTCLNTKFDTGLKLEILDMVLSNTDLPLLEGDKCTFIGSTFVILGEDEPYKNNIIALDSCTKMNDVENQEIIPCKNERDVLLNWTNLIRKENPDIIIGYNILGFDWSFLFDRADELKCKKEFMLLSKNKREECVKTISSMVLSSGNYELTFPKIAGRPQIDLYNYYRRGVSLGSYKLDAVASHYIGDMVSDYEQLNDKYIKMVSYNLTGLKKGHYIHLEIINHSKDMYKNGIKLEVKEINHDEHYFILEEKLEEINGKLRWCLAKDDINHMDIFRLTNEGPEARSKVAKYCVQDCNLVHQLFQKTCILSGMMAQAEVCYVPLYYIIMRGQGIKLLSFIAKKCALKDTLMPVVKKPLDNSGYEGAICLPPDKGLHTKPVGVNDYSSLYPSSMISENISHDSKVWTKEYDLNGKLIKIVGEQDKDGNFIYDNLSDYKYVDIEYMTYTYKRKHPKAAAKKIRVGKKICRYAQFPDGKRAIMPSVLVELLSARKKTRGFIKFKTIITKDGNKYSGLLKDNGDIYTIIDEFKNNTVIDKEDVIDISDTYNDFMKSVFDSQQAALKVVANSLYGQCGGKTSSFYDKDVAASTTATGRKLLTYAKRVIEEVYGDTIVDTKYGKVRTRANVTYGDTDSTFACYNLEDLDGTPITGKKELEITIELSIKVGEICTKFLKPPHDFEYEKTFSPFLLLSKKRYVGMLYEHNINKCKRKEMGIVLKRRDNAACVKDIYGGIIDILMKTQNVKDAVDFTKAFLKDMVNEKISLDKLIISKSLRGFYKNPKQIAHKVLADRMGKRDAGNKPSVGSRIPYIYIKTKGKVSLQGDRIEDPTYIKKNNIKPDYGFYITNQIMKPVLQIYCLLLFQIPGFKEKKIINKKLKSLDRQLKNNISSNMTIEEIDELTKKYDGKKDTLRGKYVKKLIFDNSLIKANHINNNQKSVLTFFMKK